MPFYKAEIPDILRCNLRDADFVQELQQYAADILKLLTGNKYNQFYKYLPLFTNAWYHLLTSLGNLQTLGEEYTGIIRVDSNNELVSQLMQISWLLLYVSGENLFDKLLVFLGKRLLTNQELTDDAKEKCMKTIDFLKENKYIILRMHQSLFYIFGMYHSISNRLTGIKYVLLRQWMQDKTAARSFNLLGYFSLIYLIYLFVEKLVEQSKVKYHYQNVPVENINEEKRNSKICILCMDECKNISCIPCGHLFCWECIFDSLKHLPSCPVCREPVEKASRIIPLQNY